MFIDTVVITLVLLAFFKGLRNGLVVAVFSFLALLTGLTAALKLSAVVAQYIGNNSSISQKLLPLLAFAVVFIAVVILVHLGAKTFEGLLTVVMLGWLNKLCGVILYLLIYLFIFSILLFYAAQIQIIKPDEAVQSSLTYPYLKPLAPAIISIIGHVLPFIKNVFSELKLFFDHLSGRASAAG